jgi:16S rRNA (uracil1498-N3)-methyltransferase
MATPRIHCDVTLGPGAQFALPPDAAQHVARALRLKEGDGVVVFNGRGGEYPATLTRVERGQVDVKLGQLQAIEREARIAVGLVQGLPEADKMDWIVQKAVELGVAWVQPVVCERSVVRLSGERAERRQAHWQRVAIAACEQCGRNQVPEVRAALGFPQWLGAREAAPGWVLVPGAPGLVARDAPPGPVELLVGPEGGLSEGELRLALSRGFEPAGLGPRILRAETAPLAALAAMQARWGDFG